MVNSCLNYTRDDRELINATFAPTGKTQSNGFHPTPPVSTSPRCRQPEAGEGQALGHQDEGVVRTATPSHHQGSGTPLLYTGFLDNIMQAMDFYPESVQL